MVALYLQFLILLTRKANRCIISCVVNEFWWDY